MTKKELFLKLGGFDEINLPIAYNDADYCLRLKERGFLTVWTPEAKLYHIELASRKVDNTWLANIFNYRRRRQFLAEQKYMRRRWVAIGKEDFGLAAKFLARFRKSLKIKFPESALAHKYLDGLQGLEIGGSAHNPFGLKTQNVDYTASLETKYKKFEKSLCGEAMRVDIIAPGDNLPVPDESQDFIISSHVLEHFPDPIKALKEWYRVIKKGGYIFIIVPHKNRTFDKNRKRTTLSELVGRHEGTLAVENNHRGHYSFWITEDLVELAEYLGWKIVAAHDVDDKAGNGFTLVVQKTEKNQNEKKVEIFRPPFFWIMRNKLKVLFKKNIL
jgi:SAM-dependent methyltransferase